MEVRREGAAHGYCAVRVLIDMNLSPEWSKVFESIGWTSYHWSDVGSPSAPDTDLMDWARKEDCIVLGLRSGYQTSILMSCFLNPQRCIRPFSI